MIFSNDNISLTYQYFLREKEVWTLREIIDRSEKVYTGKFGAEFYHIESQE